MVFMSNIYLKKNVYGCSLCVNVRIYTPADIIVVVKYILLISTITKALVGPELGIFASEIRHPVYISIAIHCSVHTGLEKGT